MRENGKGHHNSDLLRSSNHLVVRSMAVVDRSLLRLGENG